MDTEGRQTQTDQARRPNLAQPLQAAPGQRLPAKIRLHRLEEDQGASAEEAHVCSPVGADTTPGEPAEISGASVSHGPSCSSQGSHSATGTYA